MMPVYLAIQTLPRGIFSSYNHLNTEIELRVINVLIDFRSQFFYSYNPSSNHVSGWVSSKIDEVVVDLVRALLVFGGDPNCVNNAGQSVRHLVGTMTKDSKLLRSLSDVGATRCAKKLDSSNNC